MKFLSLAVQKLSSEQTHRQTDGQTDGQTDTQIDTQTQLKLLPTTYADGKNTSSNEKFGSEKCAIKICTRLRLCSR